MTKIKKHLFLETKPVKWLEDTYPGVKLASVVDMLLEQFMKAHYIEPLDFAAIGAKELKRLLEERDDS